MAIVKMTRLRAICPGEKRDELLYRLLHEGCVELSEPEDKLADPEWGALVSRIPSGIGAVENRNSRVAAALDALKKYAGLKSGLFILRREVSEAEFLGGGFAEEAARAADEINALVKKRGQLASAASTLSSQRMSLLPWAGVDFPLELGATANSSFFVGACPAAANVAAVQSALAQSGAAAEVIEVNSDKEQHYILALAHKDDTDTVRDALKTVQFSAAAFRGLTGTPAENIARIEDEISALNEQIVAVEAEIAGKADKAPTLQAYVDRLVQEASVAKAREKMLSSGGVVFFEGWMPTDKRELLENLFSELECAWDFAAPQDDEEPPVLLKNSKLISSMDMVTEMYSLPAYRGIDPNPLIFPFFAFFYGFMFADMAYGIIMMLAGFILTKKFRPKGAMGNILQLAKICGFTTFVCGALTGTFFGDAISVVADNFMGGKVVELWAVINPLKDPMTILIFGIAIGCLQLIVGQCIHIYMCFRDGKPWDGIFDVFPWWTVFAGIAFAFLQGSYIVLIAGAVFLVATQGRHKEGNIIKKLWGGVSSLYDITSWLGDVLSYARLMALMLATTVIASVVNILGSLAGNIIVFIVVFLVGHTFNLGINLIGTYVHAARLQYLEFMGKFYEPGGVPFAPLRYKTQYVDVIDATGKEVS